MRRDEPPIKCTCKEEEASGDAFWHSCPFAEEIHGNTGEGCRCCPSCTYDCAMDI